MAENELKVGDTVYGDFGRYGRVDVREGVVTKVTPSGRVNAHFGQHYDGNGEPIIYQFKGGRQIGGDRWHSYRLIDQAEYERLLATMREQQAVAAFVYRLREWKVGTKADAMALADEIKALAEAIPDTYGQ